MKEFSDNYLKILQTELKGLNLTRIDSPEEFFQKQIIDSILPLKECPEFKLDLLGTGRLLDIGFGGGFPILPLCKEVPTISAVGIEARAKKVKAVKLIAEKLKITNAKFHHIRCEEILIDIEVVITLKAVGKIEDFLSKLNITRPATIYFYKGPQFDSLENLSKIEKRWEIIEDRSYSVEGTDGRRIIGVRPKKVPRGTNLKNKNLVKLSSLF